MFKNLHVKFGIFLKELIFRHLIFMIQINPDFVNLSSKYLNTVYLIGRKMGFFVAAGNTRVL